MKLFDKEIVIHTNIADGLPDNHPLAFKTVDCKKCGQMLHAANNECMQTWFETEHGNYCTSCFHPSCCIESLEDCVEGV